MRRKRGREGVERVPWFDPGLPRPLLVVYFTGCLYNIHCNKYTSMT